MSKTKLKILQVLKDDADTAYTLSRSERKELHELEWKSKKTISILGETEIIVNTLFGMFSMLKKHSIRNNLEALALLTKYSVYSSPVLVEWLTRNKNQFLHFSQYLKTIESLRVAMKEFIEKQDMVIK